MKTCRTCKSEKELTDFTTYYSHCSNTRKMYYRQDCKECLRKKPVSSEAKLTYMASRREKERRQREADLKPVTERCEICGFRFAEGVKHASANWDHNHGTGKGWLCGPCNQALGQAGDNPLILLKMADYLRSRGFDITRILLS